MTTARKSLPTPEQERALHQRLMDGDPTAPADLAETFLDHLIAGLVSSNAKSVPEDLCVEAAGTAIIALIQNPASYRTDRNKGLFSYLQMSAQGDLLNCLRREKRQRGDTIPLKSLELSPVAGKYLGRADDPSLRMEMAEVERADESVLSLARAGLSDEECQALELMLQGERKTLVFAQALRLDHLSTTEQRAEVKRVKDKLKNRLKRGRGEHGQPS